MRWPALVNICRTLGVITSEDSYPVWQGPGGPARIAPLFLLYDYTFRVDGTHTKEQSLAYAYQTGIVCADEVLLHPDPFPSRQAWCRARVAETKRRLITCDPDVPLVLVNHWPLIREPTRVFAVSGVRPVVRDRTHRRLAPSLQHRGRGVWPPTYPSFQGARRGAV
jgi:hypothetical protein